MGNYFSNEQSFDDICNRLEKLERIDLNNDGIISKLEFEQWKANDLNEIKESIKNEVAEEYINKIDKLNKEIQTLKDINKNLEESLRKKNALIEEFSSNIKTDKNIDKLVTQLSQEKINNYVDELLANEATNISLLPDAIERQIYRNVFRMSFKLFNKIMESMTFELAGHHLSINMLPIS